MLGGNKEIIDKVSAAFAENNIEGFLSLCADDVEWTMVGESSVKGKEAIRRWMDTMKMPEPPKFTTDLLIAEGDFAVAQGKMTMKDKTGKTVPYSYCDLYRFRGGKIVSLTSYVINTEAKQKTSAG